MARAAQDGATFTNGEFELNIVINLELVSLGSEPNALAQSREHITIDANGGDIRSLSFLDDTVGFAVISVAGSPADRLIATTDGGRHWRTAYIWQSSA